MKRLTGGRRAKSPRVVLLLVATATTSILAGSGGATTAATADAAQAAPPVRTLLASSHGILAFSLGSRRITWISRARLPGRHHGCGMYVRTLRTGRTSFSPLIGSGCPRRVGRWALADAEAAWTEDYSCSNSECDWNIVGIHAGARRPQKIDFVAAECDQFCVVHKPHPTIAGAGTVLVYSGTNHPGDVFPTQWVNRIVSGKFVRWFDVGSEIERLAVAGGVVEAVTRVVSGDGCGCLRSPAWSPDGSTIAYLHGQFTQPWWEPGPSVAPLAVMNADGSGRRDLSVAGSARADSLSWSPDAEQIAYVTAAGNLAIVSAEGSAWRQLRPGDVPAWSPDGSKIAFVASDSSNSPALFTMNHDGSGVQELASFAGHGVGSTGMAWSPDGARIAFSLDGLLEVMNADGGNPHPLGNNTVGDEPAWSRDGGQIVFHTSTGLSVIGADGSGLHQLTNGPDEHPSWSPDGKTILFASGRDDAYANSGKHYYKAFLELYLVDRDGANLRPLSFTQPSALEDKAILRTASGKHLPSLPGLPALAGDVAAVGSVSGGVDRITLYDATTGTQLTQVAVGSARSGFSVVGAYKHWVVFHRGRTISALDTDSHRVVHLATAAASPLDLSVSVRRVAWAENIHGRGRIRYVELPPALSPAFTTNLAISGSKSNPSGEAP